MKFGLFFALYGGPDQLMPLTSGLTAIFAFLLIFWNKVLGALGKVLNLFRRHEAIQDPTDAPPDPAIANREIAERSHSEITQ
jgi:hypothetical protein